jgi:hypothetical protein
MGYKCAAFGCKTGYNSKKTTVEDGGKATSCGRDKHYSKTILAEMYISNEPVGNLLRYIYICLCQTRAIPVL